MLLQHRADRGVLCTARSLRLGSDKSGTLLGCSPQARRSAKGFRHMIPFRPLKQPAEGVVL